MRSFALSLLTLLLACTFASGAAPYFQIQVVDDQTNRGVPLVELETVNNQRFITDSNGIIAFHEPGLMDQPVYFSIRSHGYEYPKDGFGYRGLALTPVAGSSVRIPIKRLNVAQRLYRVTGQGIYRDSLLTGASVPLKQPVINGKVLGQDSVFTILYNNRIYWFWGDTNRPSYPLGQFAMSGATSLPHSQGGLDPNLGVDLTYFVDKDGFSRKMAPLPGEGLFWLEGFLTVPDPATGRERLLARYNRMKDLGTMLEHGLAIFNDDNQTFEKLVQFNMDQQWQSPRYHPLRITDNNQHYFYFPTPFPTVRVKADYKHVTDPAAYEAFSCLRPGSRYDKSNAQLDRAPDGQLLYTWKPNTSPTGQKEERELIAAGLLKPEEAHFQVRDIDTHKPLSMHAGSVYWNHFRKRYIMIAVQEHGSSYLGEVYFSESPSPTGPWRFAKKILTHDKYTFYNPKHHPLFDQDNGRLIYFEGTYANTFSGNPNQTPRYDYNQIMYLLDLSDPRLSLTPAAP